MLEQNPVGKLGRFAQEALEHVSRATSQDIWLSMADELSMLLVFAGLRPEEPELLGRTLSLGITDPILKQTLFQTVPLRDFDENPFWLEGLDGGSARVSYRPGGAEPVATWPVHVGLNFLRQGSHFFNQTLLGNEPLPATITANPKTNCSNACDGCYRAVAGFVRPDAHFVTTHVRELATEYKSRFPDLGLENLRLVSIVTGCEPTPEKEVEMFLGVMDAYRAHGFSPEFIFSTNLVNDAADMRRLRDAGAIGYVSTVEVFDDALRSKVWGKLKGQKTFAEHLETLAKAREIFQFAEAALVLGADSYDGIHRGIDALSRVGASISAGIPRSYTPHQLALLHSDVWAFGFGYFVEPFRRIYALNAQIGSTTQYIRKVASGWLAQRAGGVATAGLLPYRYRA